MRYIVKATLYSSSILFKVKHPDGDQEFLVTFEGDSRKFFEEVQKRSKNRFQLITSNF